MVQLFKRKMKLLLVQWQLEQAMAVFVRLQRLPVLGYRLKMEAIGLAGITETPLVIVDTQRGGPSTGLPTKQEQSDLMAMIYGTHGEIPKIVIAPSTVEEAFYDTAEAFNLAEEYQCPVIVLSDLQLSLRKTNS